LGAADFWTEVFTHLYPMMFGPQSHRQYNKKLGGEALDQVAQRSCGCPLLGRVPGQVGWGFEQLGLVEGVPAHDRGVGTK